MIASKSWQIHKLQSNVPDCPTVGIRPRSVRSQNAIPRNTGNAGAICCNPGDPGGTGSLFAILVQSSGLWIDCKYNAILTQFRPIGSGLRPTATHRPRIAPNWTGAQSTQNATTAILTAIFAIEFNCGEIAKSRRIARGFKGFHQNLGKSTNCEKTSPIAPRIGIHSQSVRDQSAVHPKPWQCGHNLLQSWGLRWNCRFKAIRLQSTSINTFELDCDWITKVQKITRRPKRLHQNP